jgi:hypothetical protein
MENSISGLMQIMLHYESVWLKIGVTEQKLQKYPTSYFNEICQTNHEVARKYYL